MNGNPAPELDTDPGEDGEDRLFIKEEIKQEEEDDIEVVEVVHQVIKPERRICSIGSPVTFLQRRPPPLLQCALSKSFNTTSNPSNSSNPNHFQSNPPVRIHSTKTTLIQTSNPSVIQCSGSSNMKSLPSTSTRIRSLSPPSMVSPPPMYSSMGSPSSSPSMITPTTSSKMSSSPTVYLPQRSNPNSSTKIFLPQHPDPSVAPKLYLPPSTAPSSRLALLSSRFDGHHLLSEESSLIKPMPTLIRIQQSEEAFVRIVEQPKENSLRFRYECEGRSAGSLQGVTSSAANKTFPSIEVVNHVGPVVVVASCVTVEGPPYRTHPHNLVGRDCKQGVCTINVNNESMYCTFQNVGIQCVRKKDVETSLINRESIRVDPYKTGFEHRKNPNKIDLNAVRICFQVFAEGQKGKYTKILSPVVSNPIYDAKAKKDLLIVEMSDDNSSADGGRKIIILCEKVAKEDIQVIFFEENDMGERIWEAQGDFRQSDVHKQYGINFRTPPYRNRHISEQVQVFVELRKANDQNESSDPLPFFYNPSGHPSPGVTFRDARPPSYQSVDSQMDISFSISEEDLPTVLIPSVMANASEDDVTRAVYGSPDPPARKVSVQKTVSDLFGSKRSNGSSTSGDKRAKYH